jgi:hypothetical protein
MQHIELETFLDASPDLVWDEVTKPRLLRFVARGMIKFKPIDPKVFPDRWHEGEFKVSIWWKGIVPLGKQVIAVELPPAVGNSRFMRDNGHGSMIKTWNHLITVEPFQRGTRYVDMVQIDAGLLTPLVIAFARRFYAHRQQRWKELVNRGFDYDTS